MTTTVVDVVTMMMTVSSKAQLNVVRLFATDSASTVHMPLYSFDLVLNNAEHCLAHSTNNLDDTRVITTLLTNHKGHSRKKRTSEWRTSERIT